MKSIKSRFINLAIIIFSLTFIAVIMFALDNEQTHLDGNSTDGGSFLHYLPLVIGPPLIWRRHSLFN